MNKIDYLVISSTIDFSTDLVCHQLMKNNEKFYRLNRDEFCKHKIFIDLQKQTMIISIKDEEYEAQFDKLKGIFFEHRFFANSIKG